MISIPINVMHPDYFWMLDLFCHAHKIIYGEMFLEKIHSAIITKNRINDLEYNLNINFPIRHKLIKPYFDNESLLLGEIRKERMLSPINIQLGLEKLLDEFENENTVIELLDHDMFHFRKHPDMQIGHDEFFVCDLYENWHLLSKTKYKYLIDYLIENNSLSYNGGFVPIIGTVHTFRKIINDWIKMHVQICSKTPRETDEVLWWAGMYSFNAACEKNKIKLTAKNFCYIPRLNQISDETYIAHYSVDNRFDKKKYPNIDKESFLDNDFYNIVKTWLDRTNISLDPNLPATHA